MDDGNKGGEACTAARACRKARPHAIGGGRHAMALNAWDPDLSGHGSSSRGFCRLTLCHVVHADSSAPVGVQPRHGTRVRLAWEAWEFPVQPTKGRSRGSVSRLQPAGYQRSGRCPGTAAMCGGRSLEGEREDEPHGSPAGASPGAPSPHPASPERLHGAEESRSANSWHARRSLEPASPREDGWSHPNHGPWPSRHAPPEHAQREPDRQRGRRRERSQGMLPKRPNEGVWPISYFCPL